MFTRLGGGEPSSRCNVLAVECGDGPPKLIKEGRHTRHVQGNIKVKGPTGGGRRCNRVRKHPTPITRAEEVSSKPVGSSIGKQNLPRGPIVILSDQISAWPI